MHIELNPLHTLKIIYLKNQAYTHLICAAQNMKNIAIKRTNIDEKDHDSPIFIDIFVKMTEKIKMYIKENLTFFEM